jgi:hypothetical protein
MKFYSSIVYEVFRTEYFIQWWLKITGFSFRNEKDNVFDNHFDRLNLSSSSTLSAIAKTITSLTTMWCVSELHFMIISSRAKSEINYLQKMSRFRLLRKYSTLFVFFHHMIKKHIFDIIVRVVSHDIKLAKVHLQS